MNELVRHLPADLLPKRAFGPRICDDGYWEFALHAGNAHSLSLTFSNDGLNWVTRTMARQSDGFFVLRSNEISPGARYWYVIDGVDGFPDPWSRYQPGGPHEASELVNDQEFIWHDQDWKGRAWSEAVIYELHVGSFTPQGTFLAAISKLKSLKEMGITLVQIMPIWTVPGGPSWGYDANYLFSVNADYGHPDDFKQFVDKAHALGIQVILDVVYNHLGIEGNYLSKFDDRWLLPDEENQWGAKLNFDRPGNHITRDMVIANALFWLREYHLDGLRIDAPIEIEDRSDKHILIELAEVVRDEFSDDRQVHLILENDHYAGRMDINQQVPLFGASINIKGSECLIELFQSDKFDLASEKLVNLLNCIKGGVGFEFNGEFPAGMRTSEFLHSDRQTLGLQNHDLIGNSADPQRLWDGLDERRRELALAIMCLTPSAPTFFMGDEFACKQVFPFFCHFKDVEEAAVLEGRVEDFEFSNDRPDYWSPFSRQTFEAAVLQWPDDDLLGLEENYQAISRLLTLRRRWISPLLQKSEVVSSNYQYDDKRHRVVWQFSSGVRLGFEIFAISSKESSRDTRPILQLENEHWQARWWIE